MKKGSLVEIGPVVLAKNIFKNRRCIFTMSLLLVSSLWKGQSPSFEQSSIPPSLQLKVLCAKFRSNWSCASGEMIFKSSIHFYYNIFVILSRSVTLWLSKLEFPLPKAVFPCLVDTSTVVLEKKMTVFGLGLKWAKTAELNILSDFKACSVAFTSELEILIIHFAINTLKHEY